MNQAKAHEILDNRLAQAHSLLTAFIAAGGRPNEDLGCQVFSNALWAVQELIEQAQDAFGGMSSQPKPELPGFDGPEPVEDLENEALLVLREVTEELESAAITGRTLLDAVDKVRKPAQSARSALND